MKELFAGRYALLRELGQGGTGKVFLARDEVTGGECAIKSLTLSDELPAADALRAEFQTLARVRHPALVAVHELGTAADGAPYIAMEYVPGLPADRAVARGDWGALAFMAARVARALEVLHAAGYVHGDIKPGNILVVPGPRGRPREVRLLDFGLSTLLGSGQGRHTGTAGFAPPEVVSGTAPTASTDLYGLGATLYLLACGHPAFEAADPSSILQLQRQGPAPSLPLEETGVPKAWSQLILRLMASDPAERPGSARDVRVELETLHPAARWPLSERLSTEIVVGRERGLARIDAVVHGKSGARAAVLTGPSGSGKSALIREVGARAALDGRLVTALSGAESQGVGGGAWSVLRRWHAALGSVPAGVPDSIRRALDDMASAPPVVELTPLAVAADAIVDALGAQRGRVVVLWDDAEFSDALSREWLRHCVLREQSNAAWVWARRSLTDADAEADRALAGAGVVRVIDMQTLDADGVARLVAARLAADPPAGLVDSLMRSAGGHPGLTAELLRAAAREGALEETPDGYSVSSAKLAALRVPESFEAALLERMDRLGPAARALAISLAIWGDAVPREWAETVAADSTPAVARAWEELESVDLVMETAAHEWTLQPPALGRAVVSRLQSEERERLHSRAADLLARLRPMDARARFRHLLASGRTGDALAQAGAAAIDAPPEEVATIGEAAATTIESVDPAGAAEWWAKAGQAHFLAGHNSDAVRGFERALQLATHSPERHTWRRQRASALFRLGKLDEAAEAIDEALGESVPPSVESALLTDRAALQMRKGDAPAARVAAERALAVARAANDPAEEGASANTLGLVLSQRHPSEAEEALAASERAYRRAAYPLGLARALCNRALLAHNTGRTEEAEALLLEASDLVSRGVARPAAPDVFAMLAFFSVENGRWAEARTFWADSLTAALEQGRIQDAPHSILGIAVMDVLRGRLRAALARLRDSKALIQGGSETAWQYFHQVAANLHRVRGSHHRAVRSARRALDMAVKRDDLGAAGWAWRELALAEAATGRWERAESLIQEALNVRDKITPLARGMLLILHARALLRLRKINEAKAEREAASALLAGRGWRYAEGQARQLDAELAFAEQRWAEGTTAAGDAIEIFRSLGAVPDAASAALEFARLARGSPADAQVPWRRWLQDAAAAFKRLDSLADREAALSLLVESQGVSSESSTGDARGLLAAVGRMLDSLVDFKELTSRAMRLAVEQIGGDRGVMLLNDPESGDLKPIAEYGSVDPAVRREAIGFSRTAVRRVTESGGSLLVANAASDQRVASVSVRNLGLRSIVCVPLFLGGTVIGTVYLEDRRRENAFDEADRGLLEGFAHLMAVAIQNSRGQDDARRANERLMGENLSLRQEVLAQFRTSSVIGSSHEMARVLSVIEMVARQNSTVLLTGENGTGKDLIARVIHSTGPRRHRPFVPVNCGAITETLLESELFGIEDNVATGVRGRPGKFEQAEGGTLLLDEIGEMPLHHQVALLNVIQNRELHRVGGSKAIAVDVRLIAATNRDLQQLIEEGRFRQDLFYRLNIIPIEIPALRRRKADIPALTHYFVEQFSRRAGRPAPQLSPDFIATLMRSDWPGNVRELQNYIERLLAMNQDRVLNPNPPPPDLEVLAKGLRSSTRRKLSEAVADVERQLIKDALANAKGNQSQAARHLGISEQAIRYKMRKYGLEPSRQFQRLR